MKLKCIKGTIGLNWTHHEKGDVFECDDETGNRLIAQGIVERIDIQKPDELKTIVEPMVTEAISEKPVEEEFKKVGGRWKKSKGAN